MKQPLEELAELVRKRTGISVPAARAQALRAALQRVAPGLDETGFLAAASDPVDGPSLLERLIDEVTVQETSFLRDAGQLGLIPWQRLHRTSPTAAPRQVRIWSAGCATGEEVYTLALLASEAFGSGQPPVDVLGTDISGAALAAALAGRYGKRSVRGVGEPLRQRYLEPQPDGSYLVTGRLRALVRFRRHNLAGDPVPPLGEAPFDLVVCRNVLIYFTGTLITRVSGLLERSLTAGGVLVLGATDAVARTTAVGIHSGPASRRATPRVGAPARPTTQVTRDQRLSAALEAAGKGERDDALAQVTLLLADDPMDSDAHFVQGLVTLEAGQPARAADALRRALYTDPTYALAAFTLGRAYDALGDQVAARRAYGQALRSLDPGDQRHEPMLQQVGLGDIAAACRARLKGQS